MVEEKETCMYLYIYRCIERKTLTATQSGQDLNLP